MKTTHMIAAATLFAASLSTGCGSTQAHAVAPIGQTNTTSGVLCPEGYFPSEDGVRCVLPDSASEDNFENYR